MKTYSFQIDMKMSLCLQQKINKFFLLKWLNIVYCIDIKY